MQAKCAERFALMRPIILCGAAFVQRIIGSESLETPEVLITKRARRSTLIFAVLLAFAVIHLAAHISLARNTVARNAAQDRSANAQSAELTVSFSEQFVNDFLDAMFIKAGASRAMSQNQKAKAFVRLANFIHKPKPASCCKPGVIITA